VYRPSSGLTTAISTVGLSYKYTKRWEIIADVGVSHYLDATTDSPLVAHQNVLSRAERKCTARAEQLCTSAVKPKGPAGPFGFL